MRSSRSCNRGLYSSEEPKDFEERYDKSLLVFKKIRLAPISRNDWRAQVCVKTWGGYCSTLGERC